MGVNSLIAVIDTYNLFLTKPSCGNKQPTLVGVVVRFHKR